MIRIIYTLIISLIIFLNSVGSVGAVSVVINSYPPSISNESFEINASISGASNGVNYLRVDLYKDGTTNYFGETYNGASWYSGSDGIQYFPVQIQDATASAVFQGRLGSPSSGDYPGPGNYKLKIRRYTTSGGSYTFSDPVDIQITFSTPSPTASPSPTVVPTQAATSTPTITPTVVPSKTPTPSSIKSPTPKPTNPPTLEPKILGEEVVVTPSSDTPSLVPTPLPQANTNKRITFPAILILSGVILIAFAILQLRNASKNIQNI